MPVDFNRHFSSLENDPFGRAFLQDGIYYMPDGTTIYSPTVADLVQPIPAQETALDEAKRLAIAQVREAYEAAVNAPLPFGNYIYNPMEISERIDGRTTLINSVNLTQTIAATGIKEPAEFTDADFDTIAKTLLDRNNPLKIAFRNHVLTIRAATTVAAVQAVVEAL